MDAADFAEDRIEAELERAIEAARGVVPKGEGPQECAQCGERIPQARRELGYTICVECAEWMEHNAGQRRRFSGVGV